MTQPNAVPDETPTPDIITEVRKKPTPPDESTLEDLRNKNVADLKAKLGITQSPQEMTSSLFDSDADDSSELKAIEIPKKLLAEDQDAA